MSITLQSENITATPEERTWRATIETPKGGLYTLSLHRELRVYDQNGNQIGDRVEIEPKVYSFNDIANETVTLSGTTLSVAQLSGFLAAYFDQKSQS